MNKLRGTRAWKALQAHYATFQQMHLRELFAEDAKRARRYVVEAAGWRLDYAKQRVNDETLQLLFELARERHLEAQRDAMFAGEAVNTTEQRAALHIALRAPATAVIKTAGVNVVPEVHSVLARMARCAEAIRAGEWKGYSGRPIRNIVNIGIGGSDLGPVMAFEALRYYSDRRLQLRFVSNVDGTDFTEAVRGLRPDETLFIVASKTFTTLETMTNAHTARDWLQAAAGQDEKKLAPHFLALSTNEKAVNAFGIPSEQMFGFAEWVGGRYSMDSAIGLSTMIAIGPEAFHAMLAGFHAMDEHFRSAPLEQNMPVIMGLLNVWYADFFEASTVAVLPYAHYLKRFSAYLQQLTMESNGKHVTLDGREVDYHTGSVFWGEPGTNGQHSFYQLIHQGTHLIPCDFIALAEALNPVGRHQDLLFANVVAQAEALAMGKTLAEVQQERVAAELAPHKVMAGNRPSSLLLAKRLTPETLGALVALYEHSVFTQAAIWNTNPFDQWGVELGKQLAERIVKEIESPKTKLAHDASTNAAIDWYRHARRDALANEAVPQPQPRRVLVLDIGGTSVKAKITGMDSRIKLASGPNMTPESMLEQLQQALHEYQYDVVSIGFPALIMRGRIANEPANLGSGWIGFDFAQAFGCPVKIINDAAMQALGSYTGGKMLFLGLGTGLGSTMIVDGHIEPMELAHLPYKCHTYEYYVSKRALKRLGKRRWRAEVHAEIAVLRTALEPDYIVLGGGNARLLKELPEDVRLGSNEHAFIGGFRLWEDEGAF